MLFLTSLASVEAQDRSGAPVFPTPDRPVAGITSPTYSDEKTRDGHGEAERVMNLLGITPGQRVADIGAGLGYYTVRLARRLGPGATIFATDVKVEYLNRLKERLTRERIAGVRVVLGLPRDPRLPPDSVDVAILSHMYHEIENPYEFLYRLRPALAAGARVGIIDTDEPTQRHGTPPALLRCELAAVGYRELDFVLLTPADGYLAIFATPETLPQPEAITPCRASGSRSTPTGFRKELQELIGHSSLAMTMTEDRAQARTHEVVSEESLVRN
jgi:ubiquinone/menaquinone biosynthesis C-methylase UbiE